MREIYSLLWTNFTGWAIPDLRWRAHLTTLLAGLVTLAFISTAVAEDRIALVIGNSAYDVGPLKNPANDARLMSEKLRSVEFEVVELMDGDLISMKQAI